MIEHRILAAVLVALIAYGAMTAPITEGNRNMNNFNLIGNLTRDPELRYTSDELAILNFSVAYTDHRSKEKRTSYFDCKAFGKFAESIASYKRKGDEVGLHGKLQQERWTNDEDQNRSRVVLIVEEIDYLRSKERESDDDIAARHKKPDGHPGAKKGAKRK